MIDTKELRKSAIEWECFEKFTGKVVGELLDRLEAAEKERDQFKADWLECLALAEEAKPIIDQQRSEIDALRAKIEAMEKQVPVAWMSSRNGFICKENKNPDYNVPLYALPVAKGE